MCISLRAMANSSWNPLPQKRPPTTTGGHGFGMPILCRELLTSECSDGTPEAIVRPCESWAGSMKCDPPWLLPGVWSVQMPPVNADNEFQVGLQTCKSANLKLIGSSCIDMLKFFKSGCTDSVEACKLAVRIPGLTSMGLVVDSSVLYLPYGSTSGRFRRECFGGPCSTLIAQKGQGRTTATNNQTTAHPRTRTKAGGRQPVEIPGSGFKETLAAALLLSSPAQPMPLCSRFRVTLTPLKPVHFGQPVNQYVHN